MTLAMCLALTLLIGRAAGASVYTITPGGAPVTVTTTISGENATVTFTGTQGHRISLKMSGVTITQSYVSIKKPDGTALVAQKLIGTSGGFIDATSLPATGTYTILVDPQSTYTGSMTLSLYDVPTDASGSITPGGAPATISTTTPGQNASLAFAGTAGNRVSMKLSGVTMTQVKVWIVRPDAVNLFAAVTVTNTGAFVDVKTLPLTGSYTIKIDPQVANIGSITATLYDVPPDISTSITAGGSPVTVTTTAPGQNAQLTFSGTSSGRISLKLSGVTLTQAKISLLEPDGTNLFTAITVGSAGTFVDVKTLPVTGTYRIAVDPTTSNVGSITLTLYDVPPDAAATTAPGGPPVTVTTTTPGQNANVTFSGTAGNQISLKVSSVTMTQVKVSILNPDATTFVAPVTVGSTGTFISARTLPQTGTYRIVVDPTTTNTGSLTLTLFDPTQSAGGTISPGGAAVTVGITTPGQVGQLTFAGTTGQRISLTATQSTLSSPTISIQKPDGTTLASVKPLGTADGFIDTQTLPASGTYTIVITPISGGTGSITIRLYNVPADASATTSPGGAATSLSITTPGQNGAVTFSGTAGRRISLLVGNDTIGTATGFGSNVRVLNPDGSTLVANVGFNTGGGFIDTKTLPSTGTYTIVVDPVGANTGGMTLTLYDVPPDVTSAITAGGAAVTLTMSVPGQNGNATFTGTIGDSITVTVTDATSGSKVSVLNPGGSTLVAPTTSKTISTGLATTGTYTIVVDPQAQFTGSVTLTLAETSAPPSSPTLTIGESSSAAFAGPGPTLYYRPGGQGGTFTVFAAQAGTTALQKVRFPGLSSGMTPTALTDDTSSPYSQTYTWVTGATYDSTSNPVTAYDYAGRTASSSFGVVPDSVAPVTTDSTAAIGAGWVNVPETVILSPTDAGAGVATTYSTIDGTTPSTASPTGTSLPLVSEGTYTIQYFSVDNVGNTESVKTATNQVRIDLTPPSAVTLDPLPANIRNGQVLTGSASDALSGVASIKYYRCSGTGCTPSTLIGTGAGASYPFTWSGQPADGTYTVLARAFDQAGNTLDSATQIVRIDNTAPDTTITATPAAATNQTSASFSFSATETATFTCTLDGGAATACTSPVSYSGLAAGSHTFAVTATDTVGNVDPTPATYTWTVDLTPPDTSITSTPSNPTNQTSASFSFASTETGSIFQCQLDGGGFAACTSPKTYTGLSSASHTFQVRAIDAAGNVDASPASFTWTLDATSPDTTITAGPSGATSQTAATFSFTSTKSGSTFQCRLDLGPTTSCASPMVYTGLADGSHTFTVAATDSLGNVDPTPATRSWTVDTVAPDTSITGHPADPSNAQSPSFSFSATEPAMFQCQVDGGAFGSCSSPYTASPLTEGSHTFSVRATDSAGNTDATPASFTWTVDVTPPGAPSIDSAPSGRIAQSSATLSFSNADPTAVSFGCRLDGAPATPAVCSSPATYTGLANGSHTFTLVSYDAAGNVSNAATATWTVDTTGPAVTVTTPSAGSSSSNTAPSISGAAGTAVGDLPGIAVTVYAGAGTGGSVVESLNATASGGAWSVASGTLADGTYTIVAQQSDDLGNLGASSSVTFSVDTAPPPAPTITASPAATSATTSPSFSFADGEPGATFRCSLDGASATACSSPKTLSGLAQGVHTFAVIAVDAAGNPSSAATDSWTVQSAAPTITGKPAANSATTSPSFTFTDSPYTSFQCKLDAGSFTSCSSPQSYSGLAAGSHTFTVHAVDASSVATADAVYTWIVNTTAPTISAKPTATSATAAPSFSFTSAVYTTFACKLDAGAFAACTSPQAYTGLADGSHTFTVHALDAAGVATADAVYTWTINTTAPTLNAPTLKVTGGNTTATVTFSHTVYTSFQCALDAGAFATCTSGAQFTVATGSGSHTIKVRAVDASGATTAIASRAFTA